MTREELKRKYSTKLYLGDAVYVHFDGYHFILETSDGYSFTNTIALEPEVFEALIEYRDKNYQEYKNIKD